MLITANKFAEAQATVRVRLVIDQKIRGLSLKKGDVAEVSADEARCLSRMGRVDIVIGDEGEKPKAANR